jgi:hypothetical protein
VGTRCARAAAGGLLASRRGASLERVHRPGEHLSERDGLRAAAASQADVNRCLAAIADSDNTLRGRMPACANTSGKAFEDCMYKSVLYDDNVAVTEGYSCSRHYQDEVDTLARAGAYVWLKSKVCGIGQWLGLKACQG